MSFTDYETRPKQELVTPIFREPKPEEMKIDQYETLKQGRTVYVDQVMCEVRLAADPGRRPVFPAHSIWKKVSGKPVTYADRFPNQYRAFLEGRAPTVEGTPIEELPFITAAKRAELKALAVYSVEQLESLDTEALKRLGHGGRELKTQATAFLKSRGISDAGRLATENELLRQELAALKSQQAPAHEAGLEHVEDLPPLNATADRFSPMTADELRDFIQSTGGTRPDGRYNRESLLKLARSLEA